MSSLDWNEVGQAFEELTGKKPGERTLHLEEIRQRDPSLAEELLSLLQAHDSADGFIERRVQRMLNTMAPAVPLSSGEKILHFEVVELLGAGSSAQVYLARDTELGRLVALKVTKSDNKEARTLAHFSLDGIVQVYSEHVTVYGGSNLRVMCLQFIAGPTLGELQREIKTFKDAKSLIQILERFPQRRVALEPASLKWREKLNALTVPEAIVMLGIRLAEVLSHAHEAGVLHLDIKPANILIDPFGRPYLSDFNVSTHTERLSQGDLQGMGGTPHYMPPEQRDFFDNRNAKTAAKLDQSSDVYALGIVLRDLVNTADFHDEKLDVILRWATDHDKSIRAPNAEVFGQELCAWLRRRHAEKEMPSIPRALSWIIKYPVPSLIGLTVLSQLVASAINITYNRLQIVSSLTREQYQVFMDCVTVYNGITYPLTTVVGTWLLSPLLRKVPGPFLRNTVARKGTGYLQRKTALRIPAILFAAISFGWLPGAYVFPLTIDYFAGPLSASIYLQFIGSFGLAWLISMTTSLALCILVLARALYPRYWDGDAATAAKELHFLGRLNHYLTFASALIPMAGVLLVVLLAQYATADYRSFKILLLVLVGYGLANLLLVQRLTQYVDKAFKALKRPRSFD